jgi:hypothetical protein
LLGLILSSPKTASVGGERTPRRFSRLATALPIAVADTSRSKAAPFDHRDTDPPRILQAGYTLGPPYLVVDDRGKTSGSGYLFRDHVVKAPKKDAKEGEEPAKVATGVFQQQEYNGLSALLCSRVDAANRPAEMGDDFQLAPNPHAKVPLPKGSWL